MQLFHFHLSSASYRVRIALNIKGIAVDHVLVDIRAGDQHNPEYRDINPQGLVPCLVTDDGVPLGQSVAIMEFLEERFPTPSLLPADMNDRAVARSLAQQVASDVSPFQKTTLQHYLREAFAFPEERVHAFVSHWIHRGLEPLDRLASRRLGSSGLLFGEQPGFAECFVIPQLYNAQRFGVDITAFDALQELNRRCESIEAFRAAHPDAWRPT